MALDKKTNTIFVDENSDFLVDSGVFFINMLSQTSQDKKASNELISDWHVINDWLGCKNCVITSKEEEKIGKGWKSYLAIGLAPSFKLQPAFDHFVKQYKDSGFSFKEDKPPTEVMDVFDRLLATDEELSVKRKHDWSEEKKKFESILNKLPKKNLTFKQKVSSLSKKTRIFIVTSIAWFVWVAFRTTDDWEILGIYLDEWDEDMFFANVALPIFIVWLAFKTYKWVSSAQK
ncbi:MAG: hypothetical protein QM500_09440 [Methylococcales bacterium]